MIPKLHPSIAIVLIVMGCGVAMIPIIYHLVTASQQAYVAAHNGPGVNHPVRPVGPEILIGYFVFGFSMVIFGVAAGRTRA